MNSISLIVRGLFKNYLYLIEWVLTVCVVQGSNSCRVSCQISVCRADSVPLLLSYCLHGLQWYSMFHSYMYWYFVCVSLSVLLQVCQFFSVSFLFYYFFFLSLFLFSIHWFPLSLYSLPSACFGFIFAFLCLCFWGGSLDD